MQIIAANLDARRFALKRSSIKFVLYRRTRKARTHDATLPEGFPDAEMELAFPSAVPFSEQSIHLFSCIQFGILLGGEVREA